MRSPLSNLVKHRAVGRPRVGVILISFCNCGFKRFPKKGRELCAEGPDVGSQVVTGDGVSVITIVIGRCCPPRGHAHALTQQAPVLSSVLPTQCEITRRRPPCGRSSMMDVLYGRRSLPPDDHRCQQAHVTRQPEKKRDMYKTGNLSTPVAPLLSPRDCQLTPWWSVRLFFILSQP